MTIEDQSRHEKLSVFIWNDLALAAKSSKECTPNHF